MIMMKKMSTKSKSLVICSGHGECDCSHNAPHLHNEDCDHHFGCCGYCCITIPHCKRCGKQVVDLRNSICKECKLLIYNHKHCSRCGKMIPNDEIYINQCDECHDSRW